MIFFIFSHVFGSEPYSLEKIVVRQDQGGQVITASEIREKGLSSVTDALDYVSGMDLRCRGRHGIQADLSLRGSTYEQVAVLIDGVRITDPQTGHHNLDIPLTAFDIERIEIFKEGSSGLYGAGAMAGSVNIVTRKAVKKVFNLDTLLGEHALFGNAFSFGFPGQEISGRISFDQKSSKAARPNTDFKYKTASFYLNRDFSEAHLHTLLGYQKKDFGADSFYSNLFPEEEEHTETVFFKAGIDYGLKSGFAKNSLFLRRHRDKFILRRNNPSTANYHTTYVYGLNSDYNLPLTWGKMFLGLDAGMDEIYSSNLGKHTIRHEAVKLGFDLDLKGGFTADMRLRMDNYQKWHEEESFNLGLGYIANDNWKIRSSFSRAFRIPSFTELYYSDSANKGCPELKIEDSDTATVGFDLARGTLGLSLGAFYRRGENLIDWTRVSETDIWQATNLGRVDFRGIELDLKLKPKLDCKNLKLEEITFSYNYTEADRKTSGFFSKYALDILRHQYILEIRSGTCGFKLNWQLSYNKRCFGETYFVGALYIGKRIDKKNFVLEPFVKVDNFSDTKYSEVGGVLQPGRWIQSGLRFEW